MAQNEHWWINTDVAVRITVFDRIEKIWINDAAVTGVLRDKNGDAVSGASSITFDYTSGTNGEYVGSVPDTALITDGEQYTLEITTIDASGAAQELTHVTRTARKRAA